jgi:hypothetical protein
MRPRWWPDSSVSTGIDQAVAGEFLHREILVVAGGGGFDQVKKLLRQV